MADVCRMLVTHSSNSPFWTVIVAAPTISQVVEASLQRSSSQESFSYRNRRHHLKTRTLSLLLKGTYNTTICILVARNSVGLLFRCKRRRGLQESFHGSDHRQCTIL